MKGTIALIAHDSQKNIIAEWAKQHYDELERYELVGTKGTSQYLKNMAGLSVNHFGHGHGGGDVAIANMILTDKIDFLFYFIDVKTPHGHEHDIQTLIRIATIKNITFALNKQTADCILASMKNSENIHNSKQKKW